jgi:hypothetical protein
VRRLLSDKVKTIGGTPYKVKHAGTTPTPMDVDIDGVIYSVKMADCVYRVSTNNHSEVTGALIDRGANGVYCRTGLSSHRGQRSTSLIRERGGY